MTKAESSILLLSTVLAVMGWIATHVADRITASPLLEYSVTKTTKQTTLELENLNRTIAFKNVNVIASAGHGTTITGISVVPVEPAFEGDDQPTFSRDSANFVIPNLMPRGTIRAHVTGNSGPVNFRIWSDQQPMLLIRPGLETFLAKNEIAVLLLLLPVTLSLAWLGFGALDRFHGTPSPTPAPTAATDSALPEAEG